MTKTDKKHVPRDRKQISEQLNWLRAAVLGANDGIVSIAGLVVGVAGATTDSKTILVAGIAGLLAGALSMAAGEYVSVSSQRDTELALIEKESYDLKHHPKQELAELTSIYEAKGLSPQTASKVAVELTAKDALGAHLEVELGMNRDELTSPTHAALASAISFVLGAIIPLLAILLPPAELRVPVAFLSVVIALIITGLVSSYIGGSGRTKATVRVVIGGITAMLITYGIGTLFNVNV